MPKSGICSFVLYVPLLQTLEQLLKNAELRAEVETNHQRHDSFLNDFCDGFFVKAHPLFSVCGNALQIMAYFDELEVTNPIGSYVNTHKLGCLFYSRKYQTSLLTHLQGHFSCC